MIPVLRRSARESWVSAKAPGPGLRRRICVPGPDPAPGSSSEPPGGDANTRQNESVCGFLLGDFCRVLRYGGLGRLRGDRLMEWAYTGMFSGANSMDSRQSEEEMGVSGMIQPGFSYYGRTRNSCWE